MLKIAVTISQSAGDRRTSPPFLMDRRLTEAEWRAVWDGVSRGINDARDLQAIGNNPERDERPAGNDAAAFTKDDS